MPLALLILAGAVLGSLSVRSALTHMHPANGPPAIPSVLLVLGGRSPVSRYSLWSAVL